MWERERTGVVECQDSELPRGPKRACLVTPPPSSTSSSLFLAVMDTFTHPHRAAAPLSPPSSFLPQNFTRPPRSKDPRPPPTSRYVPLTLATGSPLAPIRRTSILCSADRTSLLPFMEDPLVLSTLIQACSASLIREINFALNHPANDIPNLYVPMLEAEGACVPVTVNKLRHALEEVAMGHQSRLFGTREVLVLVSYDNCRGGDESAAHSLHAHLSTARSSASPGSSPPPPRLPSPRQVASRSTPSPSPSTPSRQREPPFPGPLGLRSQEKSCDVTEGKSKGRGDKGENPDKVKRWDVAWDTQDNIHEDAHGAGRDAESDGDDDAADDDDTDWLQQKSQSEDAEFLQMLLRRAGVDVPVG